MSYQFIPSPLRLGQINATRKALEALRVAKIDPSKVLGMHCVGEWGDLHLENNLMNFEAVTKGGKVLSAYQLTPGGMAGERIWIITEEDRSQTTILLPEEYQPNSD